MVLSNTKRRKKKEIFFLVPGRMRLYDFLLLEGVKGNDNFEVSFRLQSFLC